MTLMQKLIAKTAAMEATTTRDEKNAEESYQLEMEKSQGAIDAYNESLANQNDSKAKTTKALMQTKKSLEGSEFELADLAQEEAAPKLRFPVEELGLVRLEEGLGGAPWCLLGTTRRLSAKVDER